MINKEKIKAVIFDWGGVCCREGEPFASQALQKALSMNPEQIAGEVRDIYNGYYKGEYDRDSFWQAVINHFNLKGDSKINPQALSSAYLNSYSIYQDVLNIALKLQNKYRVGLLSNLTPEMKNYVRSKHHLGKYFKPEVYSCDPDVKSMKPDLEPYRIIIKKMDVEAENCLFIDNSLKNIKAAGEIGMQGLLFSDRPQFLRDIAILF